MSVTARLGVLVAAIVVASCSGGGGPRPVGPKVAGSSDAGPKNGKVDKARQTPKEIAFPDCATNGCVLHRGTARYHVCLLASDGKCAHFGTVCNPTDPCVFDVAKRRHRRCDRMALGVCESFGAECSPKSSCQIDPTDGLYRQCLEPRAGVCARFGDVCQPH